LCKSEPNSSHDGDYVKSSHNIVCDDVNLGDECDYVPETQPDAFLSDLLVSPTHYAGGTSKE
jgi:hypothetical protein